VEFATTSRQMSTSVTLRQAVTTTLAHAAEAADWPGPLTVQAQAQAWEPKGGRTGEPYACLEQIVTAMCLLQVACEGGASKTKQTSELESDAGANSEPPLHHLVEPLWAASELVGPLAEGIHYHFTGGRPADNIEKPERLFALLAATAGTLHGTTAVAAMLEHACAACRIATGCRTASGGGEGSTPCPSTAPLVRALATAAAPLLLRSHILPGLLSRNLPSMLWCASHPSNLSHAQGKR
jgi:hypothetical protein